MKKLFLLSCLILAYASNNLSAQIINIPADYPTIQQGIDASQDGDTVLVQSGTYEENINFNGKSIVLASTYLITQDTNAIYQTIIDGRWWDRAVKIINYENESTLLIGFSIKNGVGGIQITNSNANVSNCRIFDNILPGDAAGAGIAISGDSDPGDGEYSNWANVRNCYISNNDSRHGSGITLLHNKGIVENCRIDNNTSWESGSQVLFWSIDQTTLKNCYIKEDHLKGHIIEFRGGCSPLLINNIIFVSTSSLVFDSWEASSPILINNTIIGTSGQQGNLARILPPSHFTIFNSIATGFYMADTMGYTSGYCRFDNLADGLGNITSNPLLNADYSLSDCSPCIGAGTLSFEFNDSTYYAPNNDYRYIDRPQPVGSIPDMGAIENLLGVPFIPPNILSHPISNTLCEGESYSLFVQVTGSPEITFQWQKNNVDMPGETNDTIHLINLIPSDEANYRCLVTNMCETKYSNQAFVEVIEYPEVTTQPQSEILYFGNDAQFTIGATGDEPLSYQWYGPLGLLEDDTLSQLLITNISTSDTGNYYCTITNVCGSATSNSATLTAYNQLTISAGTDVTIMLGDSTILDGSYSGGSPSLTIHWTPDTLLYDPNILNPQTVALYSSQAFTLTIHDLLVGYQTSDEVFITVIEDDTLAYFPPENDTLYNYITRGYCGYISGNNCDLDKIKANYFTDELISYDIEKVLLRFGKAVKTTADEVPVKIGIWAKSTENDKPGDLIENITVPLSHIVQDVAAGNITTVAFPTPVATPKDFFVGVFLPTGAGDTLALMTNKDGESEAGIAWTLNGVNEWLSYSSDPRYFLRVANAIFPVVRQNNVGIHDFPQVTGNLLIYPNPANDVLNIQFEAGLSNLDAQLCIYDIQGKAIITEPIQQEKTNVNIGNLNPGVYVIRVEYNQNLVTRKLIVY